MVQKSSTAKPPGMVLKTLVVQHPDSMTSTRQPGYGAEDGGELPGLVHWGEGWDEMMTIFVWCLRGRWLPGEQKMCFFLLNNQDLGETDWFGIRG